MIQFRNITLNADAKAIEQARQKAKEEGLSLNIKFRQWLKQYTHPDGQAQSYEVLMKSLEHVSPGRTFTREEANER